MQAAAVSAGSISWGEKGHKHPSRAKSVGSEECRAETRTGQDRAGDTPRHQHHHLTQKEFSTKTINQVTPRVSMLGLPWSP